TTNTRSHRPQASLAMRLPTPGPAVRGHFIVISGGRCRREFAILKPLGLLRRQVSSITAWQVSILTGLALLAGLPLGVAAGRWTWALFCHSLGLPAAAVVTPWRPVLLMIPAGIALANPVA